MKDYLVSGGIGYRLLGSLLRRRAQIVVRLYDLRSVASASRRGGVTRSPPLVSWRKFQNNLVWLRKGQDE